MDAFFLKLFLSGLVGGVWVAGAMAAAERFGGAVGGFIGGLPSLVLVTYLFIGWTLGPEQARAATTSFPLTYAISALCVFLYVLRPWSSVRRGVFTFVATWCVLQGLVVLFGFDSYPAALALWGVFLGTVLHYLRKRGDQSVAGTSAAPRRRASLVTRVAISCTIIMAAVALSNAGGPIFGSVFAAFPGVFLSTLLLAHRDGGAEFARALLAPMIVSGCINCIVYVSVLRWCLSVFGILASTLIAVAAVGVSGYVSRRLLRRLCVPRVAT